MDKQAVRRLVEDIFGYRTLIGGAEVECAAVLYSLFNTLTQREKEVLVRRYRDGWTRKRIAESLVNRTDGTEGISTTRVQQIEAKALRKLWHPTRSDRLRPFITHHMPFRVSTVER